MSLAKRYKPDNVELDILSSSVTSIMAKEMKAREKSIDREAVTQKNRIGPAVSTRSSLNKSIGIEEEADETFELSRYSKFLNWLLERQEYADPDTHGWRIKFRRVFLHLGVMGFTYTTYDTLMSTQDYSSKKEIQKMLDYIGTNLTWPDEGSALDDVFELYNKTQKSRSYMMISATLLFLTSLIMDLTSYVSSSKKLKVIFVAGGRVTNFIGSFLVFASVILVVLPNYLEATHLEAICPYCGHEFNRMVKQVVEFSIGLFFAYLFTFQILPVLITIPPALVRASVLILVHPGLKGQDRLVALRTSILQQVIIVSSLLSFPITFVSMCIIHQRQKDPVVSCLIVLFWSLPPLTLFLGLWCSRRFQRSSILMCVYYMYNFVYFGLLLCLLIYSLRLDQFISMLNNWLMDPAMWSGTVAKIFLCNVVISDLLYMTVF